MKQINMLLIMSVVVAFANPVWAEDCAKARELTIEAYQAGRQGAPAEEQRPLLEEALRLCPEDADAQNNLGVLLEDDGQYEEALSHYQKAARLKPDMPEAWFGIGEVYRKTARYALALEAYLQTCDDPDARIRIEEILASQRYRTVEEGDLLEQESLELLFDAERREVMNHGLQACGFEFVLNRDTGVRYRAYVEPEFTFRNILFDQQKAALKEGTEQLMRVAAALQRYPKTRVFIGGHTDKLWRAATSDEERTRLNQELSEARAATVANYLQSQGISESRMGVRGYGLTQPEVDADSEEAYRKNRRVVLRVE